MMLSGNLAISWTSAENPTSDLVEVGLSLILMALWVVFKHYTPAISKTFNLETRFSF
jgi:hypothetical protein